MSSNRCLEEWYDLMIRHFNSLNAVWSSLTPIHGTIDLNSTKKDALYKCVQTQFSFSSIQPLFSYPKFGHDVPVWLSEDDIEDFWADDVIRIMIVSQDPLRDRGLAGEILFSSPFGLHCYDYRNKGGEVMMKIIQGVWQGAKKKNPDKKVVVYLTDLNKFYIDGRNSMKILEKNYSSIYSTFKSILDDEIDAFKPHLIVTLGNKVKENLLGNGIPFWSNQRYNGISVLPSLHTSARAQDWSKCLNGLRAIAINKANHIAQEIIKRI